MVPISVSLQFSVNDDILSRIEALLPFTEMASDCHPSGIVRTATILPVDEEVAIVPPGNRKDILWLGFHVFPGAVD